MFGIPTNDADFERLSLDYAIANYFGKGDFYGRSGQAQYGIDSILILNDGTYIGVQSKRYRKTALTAKLLQAELDAAHLIEPKLGRYIVATTAPRNARLQDWARTATLHGKTAVDIIFWESIAQWILADPIRKAEYLGLHLFECAEIIAAQIPGRTSREIVTFAMSVGAIKADDSQELIEARTLLRSGQARAALQRIQPAIDHGTQEPGAWRIAAFAQIHLGDPQSSLMLLERAALMGLRGARFELVRATALLSLGQTDSATRILRDAQAEAHDDADHGALMGSWWSHCLEIENLSYSELSARIKPGDLVHSEVHVALANAAANEGNGARTAEHLAILETSAEIDRCVVPLLRALAPVAAGDQIAARRGGELGEGKERTAIVDAVEVLEATIDDLRSAPGSANRAVALTVLARGQILLKSFDKADRAFIDLIAIPGASKAVRLITGYATSFGRHAVVQALICSAELQSHPIVKLLRLEHESLPAEVVAAEVSELFETLSDLDEWLPFVLATAVAQNSNLERWPVWLERAVRMLPTLNDADSLVLNLAKIVIRGEAHPAAESVASQLQTYAPIHRLNIGTLAQLVASFRLNTQTELHSLYGAALDRAIDAGEMPMQLHEQYLIIHETLARLGLSRAASCLDTWFAPTDNRRTAQGLRIELGWWQGDLLTCYRHLAAICQTPQAKPSDILQMTMTALLCGKLKDARRLLRYRELPSVATVEDSGALSHALLLVGLTKRREEVLGQFTTLPDPDGKALPLLLGELTNRRVAPNPDLIAVNTLTRLERVDDPTRQLRLWVTPTRGESAPNVERAAIDEVWIAPLLGQPVGATITIARGIYAGAWRVVGIEPGSIGLSLNAIHKAERIGLGAGGVDRFDVSDDPADTIRRLLKESGIGRLDREPEGPILALAHRQKTTPMKLMSRFQSYRMAWGLIDEELHDYALLRLSRAGFIVDPLTALVLESTQSLDHVSRGAGKLYIAPQSRITLRQWWYDQRNARQALGQARLLPDDRLFIQEFDPGYRKRVAGFWRKLSQAEDAHVHVLTEPFPDSVGAQMAALIEVFGASMACTCAYAIALKRPIVSIDGKLVSLLRAFEVPAISLPGLLTYAVTQGRLSWRESAAIKSSLRHAGWTFTAARKGELVALLNAKDETRASDIHGLLEDAVEADIKSALGVIVGALNQVGPEVSTIGNEDAASVLFRKLPPVPSKGRKESSSHVPDARKAWYKDAYWAWRRGTL